MKPFDLLVVGAGPAGSSAAILLARAGRSVCVVEKAMFPRRKVCGEHISGAAWPLLEELGVADRVNERAGPEVRRVGLFSGDVVLDAPMPGVADWPSGRAIGREHLDTILLERARACGAVVMRPWSVSAIRAQGDAIECTVEGRDETRHVLARTVIGAHGAWEAGNLPTQPARASAGPRELLGFKAHLRGARLDGDLMPLVVFPGGYGGLVWSDAGRVSFSCCVRREALAAARARRPALRAGDALLDHALCANRGMRDALAAAEVDGAWLSAGPIRPAIRKFHEGGMIAIGNAAGEAHPIVAEGISMAIQSAFLLCEALPDARRYEAAWRRNFAARVHAAALFARVLMHPLAGRAAVGLLAALPAALTFGAHWSGKDLALLRGVAPSGTGSQ